MLFRVIPWLCFRFLAQPSLTHPALNAVTSFRVFPCNSVANLMLPLILPSVVNLLLFTNLHLKPNLFELNLVLC